MVSKGGLVERARLTEEESRAMEYLVDIPRRCDRESLVEAQLGKALWAVAGWLGEDIGYGQALAYNLVAELEASGIKRVGG